MSLIVQAGSAASGWRRIAAQPAAWWRALAACLAGGANAVSASMDRGRQRRRLAELDDYLLRDIGVTRAEARRECAKPFWKP